MFDFFKKRKNIMGIGKIKESETVQDIESIHDQPKTLGDLAKSGHLFFRFSQSQSGRSVEKVFAEYIPGQITEAKDEDKYLSFVTEETIAICFMYGDMLTSLKFDLNDEEFNKIANTPFTYLGGSLGEYESKYLLVENNYSLEDVNTIVMLFDYVASNRQLHTIFHFTFGSLEQRLHKFGYYESEKLVRYLREEFDKNIHISPEEIRKLLRKYLNEQKNYTSSLYVTNSSI